MLIAVTALLIGAALIIIPNSLPTGFWQGLLPIGVVALIVGLILLWKGY